MANSSPLFALCWVILLVFLAWPLALAACFLWVILQVRFLRATASDDSYHQLKAQKAAHIHLS